jgi:hypothetical protein
VVIKRIALMSLGFMLLALGAVGVVLPVLPTTPFVLAAAVCFSASNERIHGWLKRNRVFGPYIENYRTKQGIRMPLKLSSIAFVWLGLAVSIYRVQTPWVTALLAAVGIGVTVHLVMIKTYKGDK